MQCSSPIAMSAAAEVLAKTIDAASLADREKIAAAIEFEISRRALGPMPDAFRPDIVVTAQSDFHRLVADLTDLADAAPEDVRILAASVREHVGERAAGAPDSLAILAAFGMLQLQHDYRDADLGLASVAEYLGLRPRDLRWAGRYLKITAKRLKRTQPELHEALITAIEIVRDQLLKGVGDTKYFRGPAATLGIRMLLI
jgi:hypothetical protein